MDKPDYSMYILSKSDWKYFYGELEDELPGRMLEPKGNEVIVSGFCDANLNHDLTTGYTIQILLV